MTIRYAQMGICVADMERSMRFYCEGLGFKPANDPAIIGAEWSEHTGLPGTELEARIIERDDVRLELLHFRSPAVEGDGGVRAMNQRGITHLNFHVSDVDATARELEAVGGTIRDSTRFQMSRPGGSLDAMYVTDPDGVRIDLMHASPTDD